MMQHKRVIRANRFIGVSITGQSKKSCLVFSYRIFRFASFQLRFYSFRRIAVNEELEGRSIGIGFSDSDTKLEILIRYVLT